MPHSLDGAAADVIGLAITLALTFVLGLEREESGVREHGSVIAGVRTIPIIGLLGHGLALLSAVSLLPLAVGFAVVGAFLVVAYQAKLQQNRSGVTTEFSALLAYLVGAMVAMGRTSAAAALTVAAVLLLTGKQPLRQFAAALPAREITTFVTFLLLAGVILPVLPNEPFTRFHINPFQAWLVVVAVSGISYASYLLQKFTRADQSLLLTALLGGLYSSTATTVAIARQSVNDPTATRTAGGIILATGTMYLRILILVWTFSSEFGRRMAPALLGLALLGSAAGIAMILGRRAAPAAVPPPEGAAPHPLEIGAAVLFAALYIGLAIGTQLTAEYLGDAGLIALAVLVGLTDIVPFILGLVGNLGGSVSPEVAVAAIMVSIASNNVVKGVYALLLGNRRAGLLALAGLTLLALLTIAAGVVV
ncbi:MAG: MgtC/SapB family protein [Candidatus Binatia bacterium]